MANLCAADLLFGLSIHAALSGNGKRVSFCVDASPQVFEMFSADDYDRRAFNDGNVNALNMPGEKNADSTISDCNGFIPRFKRAGSSRTKNYIDAHILKLISPFLIPRSMMRTAMTCKSILRFFDDVSLCEHWRLRLQSCNLLGARGLSSGNDSKRCACFSPDTADSHHSHSHSHSHSPTRESPFPVEQDSASIVDTVNAAAHADSCYLFQDYAAYHRRLSCIFRGLHKHFVSRSTLPLPCDVFLNDAEYVAEHWESSIIEIFAIGRQGDTQVQGREHGQENAPGQTCINEPNELSAAFVAYCLHLRDKRSFLGHDRIELQKTEETRSEGDGVACHRTKQDDARRPAAVPACRALALSAGDDSSSSDSYSDDSNDDGDSDEDDVGVSPTAVVVTAADDFSCFGSGFGQRCLELYCERFCTQTLEIDWGSSDDDEEEAEQIGSAVDALKSIVAQCDSNEGDEGDEDRDGDNTTGQWQGQTSRLVLSICDVSGSRALVGSMGSPSVQGGDFLTGAGARDATVASYPIVDLFPDLSSGMDEREFADYTSRYSLDSGQQSFGRNSDARDWDGDDGDSFEAGPVSGDGNCEGAGLAGKQFMLHLDDIRLKLKSSPFPCPSNETTTTAAIRVSSHCPYVIVLSESD
jgi:hypothetical protein